MAVYDGLRLLVLAAVAGSALLALGSWAVTTRRLNPFGRPARVARRMSDPVVKPVERWLVVRGRNPQSAPWWLLGMAIVGGIVVLTLAGWLIETAARLLAAAQSGPRSVARLAVYLAAQVVLFSLIARVIGSWFGAGRYSPLLRPAYRLTDWIVEPLRRFIPPIGMIDITPLAAWLLLQILLSLVLRVL
jgi:YggT family protein